jgi:LEA14-like dessication related protein
MHRFSLSSFASGPVLACALLCSLAACAGFPRTVEKPTAEVREVSVGAVSLSGMRGEVALDVFNPNGFSVPLHRVDWQLEVGGARAVAGAFDLSHNIPARGIAPVTVDLRVDARDAAAVARRLAAGERTYVLRGVLHFSTTFGAISVQFESTGTLG